MTGNRMCSEIWRNLTVGDYNVHAQRKLPVTDRHPDNVDMTIAGKVECISKKIQ